MTIRRAASISACFVGAIFVSGCGTPDPGPAGGSGACVATSQDIVEKLRCLPGVTVVADFGLTTGGADAGFRRIDLAIDQLANHDDPKSAHFQQQLTLWHRDDAAPVALSSTGYLIGRNRNELSRTFGYNVLQVEHRYFGTSIPSATDWSFLDIQKAAGDYHVIVQTFKSLFRGKWVGTGVSKGGMTSIYHRRFFPEDLDATVAYVAPNLFGLADPRFVDFLQTVGGPSSQGCRSALVDLQNEVLSRRAEIEPLMTGTYDVVRGKDIALEHAVLEMPFLFWQYQNPNDPRLGCSAIPQRDAPIERLFDFFSTVALPNYMDRGLLPFLAYYHQSAHQTGAAGVDDALILPSLRHRETYVPSHYLPLGIAAPTWDGDAMIDIQNWVKSSGTTLMFINGELDPWSAAKFEIGNTGDNHVYASPGGNHRANLANLGASDRADAYSILERWLGAPPTSRSSVVESLVADEEIARPPL